jgi:hypothetical protein
MAVIIILLQLLLAVIATDATPLQRRGTLPNDQIIGLAEATPDGIVGSVYETYQPFLDVHNGCVPYPAVDANGKNKYILPAQNT